MATNRRGGNAGPSSRGGFTLIELLVIIGILVILSGVALGPVGVGIKQAPESTSLQFAHQLGALEFAYSNDHEQTYPYGPDGHSVANLLLSGGYANNPEIFYLEATPGAVKYAGSTKTYNLTAANCNWDFWMNGNAGMNAQANDLTPLLQTTTGIPMSGLPTTEGTGVTLTIDPTKTAFGSDGIAVYYKGNNAVFIKCTAVSSMAAVNLPSSSNPYVGPKYADPAGASYHSVLP